MKRFSIKPLGNRVIVKRWPEEDAYGDGTIVKADVAKEKMLMGTVLSVGTDCKSGLTAPCDVFFGRFAGVEIDEHFGKDLVMMREEEVQALVFIEDNGVEEEVSDAGPQEAN